jgi:hypothetical protein
MRRDKEEREACLTLLFEDLEAADAWRGWDYWTVVTKGGVSPLEIREHWTLVDVVEYSIELQITGFIKALP